MPYTIGVLDLDMTMTDLEPSDPETVALDMGDSAITATVEVVGGKVEIVLISVPPAFEANRAEAEQHVRSALRVPHPGLRARAALVRNFRRSARAGEVVL